MPGAEIGPTKGKATPMPGTVQERLIRLWASPQGAAKAAVAGTTETFWLGANPGTLFAEIVKIWAENLLVARSEESYESTFPNSQVYRDERN